MEPGSGMLSTLNGQSVVELLKNSSTNHFQNNYCDISKDLLLAHATEQKQIPGILP